MSIQLKKETVYIVTAKGGELNLSILNEELSWIRTLSWNKSIWKPGDALIDRKSGSRRPDVGQNFNSKDFEIVKGGWNHDHCDLCTSRIDENDIVYIANENILCENCFLDFVKPDNVEVKIRLMKKIIK